MDQARQQVVDTIQAHSNILVTVSTNPSVDELSAALGLTILLNNMDKRATSVFSGTIPSAINFLEPDKTFENSADSLRDFIIALDKEKADHLRYKVEGETVKIFITPYKTQLTQSDLEFSQGDYNVELVIALGVTDQGHLDKALEAHGKILHDATVMTITSGKTPSTLGGVDWHNEKASSLSEMVASLAEALKTDKSLLDQQISTSLLTGIVSATDRFSNDHTSSTVMTIAAQLMAAGANQQLIAAKLEEAHDIAPGISKSETSTDTKTESSAELSIDRPSKEEKPADATVATAVTPPDNSPHEEELEKQLASVTTAPTGTLADIEKQLQEEAVTPPVEEVPQPEPQSSVAESPVPPPAPDVPVDPTPALPEVPATESPVVAPPVVDTPPSLPTESKDAMMPGFEPTGAPVAPPQPEEPAPAVLPPVVPPTPPTETFPEIVQRHDTAANPPSGEAPPINSIQNGPEQPFVNPFDQPINSPEAQSIAPNANVANVGTAEGAALLNASDSPPVAPLQPAPVQTIEEEPVAPPPLPSVPSVPTLPPLPPMPANASSIPLPPPPPPPPIDMSAGLPPMPSGPVSGDIFGDSNAAAAPPPPPPEPGQFRIPGQG